MNQIAAAQFIDWVTEGLEVHRLLGPQATVVTEPGEMLIWPNKFAEPFVVTFSPNGNMDSLALPPFQEGSGAAARAFLAVNVSVHLDATAQSREETFMPVFWA